MKLGSLFDGIGGFPLSGTKYGFEPVWASEIEPFPIKVTQHHFPDMKHLGDVTKINGAEIEPVDVVTFGSPCTRLSVAGRHDGFDITFKCTGEKDNPHEVYSKTIRAINKYQYKYTDKCPVCGQELSETNESALFFHAIRIINEMRDATNDIYPRFIVWENVPGAFSSNQGEDFRAVLEEIAEAEIPMPRSGKWATAGMVRTERVDVAWRTLDAQHWGVPQRRKRIFLVADFRGQCAGEILFVEQGLSRHPAESREAGQETAATVGDGIKTAIPINTQIATRHNKLGRGTGFGIGEDGDPSFTLQEAHSHAVCCKTVVLADQGGSVMSVHNDISPTLRAQEHGHQPIVMREVSRTLRAEAGAPKHEADWESLIIEPRSQDGVCRIHDDGIVPTLNTAQGGQRQPCVCIQNATRGKSQNGLGVSQDDTSYTLDSLGNHAVVAPTVDANINAKWGSNQWVDQWGEFMSTYAVRRLTPTECLRLQGFPDWWLDIEGASDTAKYKAIGNSVAIPCVDFVMSGIARALREGDGKCKT